jgi:hypothetical protein
VSLAGVVLAWVLSVTGLLLVVYADALCGTGMLLGGRSGDTVSLADGAG